MSAMMQFKTSEGVEQHTKHASYVKSMMHNHSIGEWASSANFYRERKLLRVMREATVEKSNCKPIIRDEHLIPRGRHAWTEYMLKLVKTKTCVEYLSDLELRSVIQQARKIYKQQFDVELDPDLPPCYYWTEEDVADWLSNEGFPEFKQLILLNRITGRKLISVDASSLNKMGVRDLDVITRVTSKIRALLGIPRPNMMRALARVVPFEKYLRKRMHTGRRVDALTFKEFCGQEGFPYAALIKSNKAAKVPCSCPVSVESFGLERAESTDDIDSGYSLASAPTVEFVVRNVEVHNQVVQELIEEMLSCVLGEDETCKATSLPKTITVLLDAGYKALDITDECRHSKERLSFASDVASGLVQEMMRCASILQDIEVTKEKLQCDISEEELEDMRVAATLFIEQVLPLASLLSAGEFSLESIFRQEPEFNYFVDNICSTALARLDQEEENKKLQRRRVGEKHESTFSVVSVNQEPVDCGKNLTQYGNLPSPCADNFKDGRRIPCPNWPPKEKDAKPVTKTCLKWADEEFKPAMYKLSVFVSAAAQREPSLDDDTYIPGPERTLTDVINGSIYSSSYDSYQSGATTANNSFSEQRNPIQEISDIIKSEIDLGYDYPDYANEPKAEAEPSIMPKPAEKYAQLNQLPGPPSNSIAEDNSGSKIQRPLETFEIRASSDYSDNSRLLNVEPADSRVSQGFDVTLSKSGLQI